MMIVYVGWLFFLLLSVIILFQEFSSSEFQYYGSALPCRRLAVENIGLGPVRSWVRMSAGLFGWVDGWHDWTLFLINMISCGSIYRVAILFSYIYILDSSYVFAHFYDNDIV